MQKKNDTENNDTGTNHTKNNDAEKNDTENKVIICCSFYFFSHSRLTGSVC